MVLHGHWFNRGGIQLGHGVHEVHAVLPILYRARERHCVVLEIRKQIRPNRVNCVNRVDGLRGRKTESAAVAIGKGRMTRGAMG